MRFTQCIVTLLAALLLLSVAEAWSTGINLRTRDAVVWGQNQIIRGNVNTSGIRSGTLYFNGTAIPFAVPAPGDSFAVPVHVGEGTSFFVATIDSAGTLSTSDTVRLSLGYRLRPEVYAYPTVEGRTVTLHAAVVSNPDSSIISFAWTPDPHNPGPVAINTPFDSLASLTLAPAAPAGDYYFNVEVLGGGDSVRARTYVTVTPDSLHPFQIKTDHARWIDSAVVYGITPSIFVMEGRFPNITAKLPDLVRLGVNTLWIQPVYRTYGGGQGYDVIDYFSIRPDLGSEDELRTLVQTAHASGLKVILDFIPNHTSIHHPYAVQSSQLGTASHYYDFYQRSADTVAYSSNYHYYQGFVNYFWNDLPNLNYNNPEVQRWITEAGTYWIQRLDIDGYRVDAVWGVNARKPEFMKEWRLALKRIKPEILLLAEDKATWPSVFDERYDAAYDWAAEQSWVSHWVWQATYSASSNPTIFNYTTQNQRSAALRSSLTNGGAGYSPRAIVFRFMENNDTFRFLATHDAARTRMVAAMMFSLNGIPSVFNGQEIGAATPAYSAYSIFDAGRSIPAQDQSGLFAYYQQLIRLRKMFPSLSSKNYQEVSVSPGASVFAYRRWEKTENVFAVVNMGNAAVSATLQIPTSQLTLEPARTYFLTDLITNEYISGTPQSLASVSIPMNAYSTRLFVLADTIARTVGVEEPVVADIPGELALAQNYPNPFNPSTTIAFELPGTVSVSLRVYDVLGREVSVLMQGEKPAGRYQVVFNGDGFASGVYFYRLQTGSTSLVRKMLMMR